MGGFQRETSHASANDDAAQLAAVHTLVMAGSPGDLAARLAPFVLRAVEEGDAVHVNLTATRGTALRHRLGAAADAVIWTDTEAWAAHPVRRLRELYRLVDEQLAGGAARLRFVGECAWPEDEPDLRAEWERFDAVLNRALEGRPVTMVCVYDEEEHSPQSLERAHACHPYVGVEPPCPAPGYVEPEAFLALDRAARLEVPAHAVRLSGALVPGTVRAQLGALLFGTGGLAPLDGTMDGDVADALLVTTTELVTNAWQAGAAAVDVACWRDGAWAVVQVDDDGPGLTDPLAGYRRPPVDALGGRGLWITRQLADAVDIAAGDWGTSIRLRLRSLEITAGV